MKKTYPSDLNKKAWKYMKKRLPKRKNKHSLKWSWRIILNAIFYLQRTGCQWRYLPESLPPWKTVYHYARIWRLNGFWEKLNTELREHLRVRDGKNAQPSAGSMDTQVSSSTMVGGISGYNGYKNVNGRKRFLLVDTLGFLLKAKIVPGNWSEKDAAMVGLEGLEVVFSRMELLWADQGFKGWEFTAWLKGTVKWTLELTSGISRPGKEDFKIAPKRWVAERTIAWLLSNRRLARSFERLVESEEAFMYSCMTRLMLARL
jgi:putative transposase